MDLSLETCEIFSPNIEAKCLARNEKKAMEILKQALEELEKAKHQMLKNEYSKLFNEYTQAYEIIAGKHVDEAQAINTHNQHDVYKTAEGKYVTEEQAVFYNAIKVQEGINLVQNQAVLNAKNLIYSGDDAIIAAIRVAKLKGLRQASAEKTQREIDDTGQEDQPLSFYDEVVDPVTTTGRTEHHTSMGEL